MGTKDYEYIRCEPRLFRYTFETPLEMDAGDRFQRGVDVISEILEAFQHLVRPTSVEYTLGDDSEDRTYERTLSDEAGLEPAAITDALRQTATETVGTPHLTVFSLTESVRVTLSEGVRYVADPTRSPAFRDEGSSSTEVTAPLTFELRQHDVMKPSQTEILTITGHSDHWLNGSEGGVSEATPLAKLDQSRLFAGVSHLYDAIDPLEITLDAFERRDGKAVAWEAVPGFELLRERHCVEWVLKNFDRRRPDETTLELVYTGDEVHPLVNAADGKLQTFLEATAPADTYPEGTTVIVQYPDDEARLTRSRRGSWSFDARSSL